MAVLAKRMECDQYGNCYYTSWDNWVRWVVLAVIVVLFLILFFLCSCVTARRRRRQGQSPYYGTGWTARPWQQQNTYHHQPYYNNNNQYPPPPPQYSSDVPAGHQGYYGQQSGIELQQPPNAFAPGRSGDGYEPPVGPPPKKGDNIIR